MSVANIHLKDKTQLAMVECGLLTEHILGEGPGHMYIIMSPHIFNS